MIDFILVVLGVLSVIYITDRYIYYKIGQHLVANQIPFNYKNKNKILVIKMSIEIKNEI